jgi:thymidylate synthase
MVVVKEMLAKEGPSAVFDKARAVAKEYAYKLRQEGKISFSDPEEGERPSIHIVRRTVPEAWEDTIMALLGLGASVRTDYDPKDKNGEYLSFPSLEGTVMMHIREPAGEPRFHKHYLGGWMGFGDYRAEIEGVKDPWMIQPADVAKAMRDGKFDEIKGDERWNYTYSQRFRTYPFFDQNGKLRTVNQLQQVINKLVEEKEISKSAQCITWDPRWDHNDGQISYTECVEKDQDPNLKGIPKTVEKQALWDSYHSPCLQRFWFRLEPLTSRPGYRLNVNGDWRSRDHLKAVPSNIYGVTEGIHEQVRLGVQERLGVPIERGSYIDKSDSLHLYGHYLDPRKQGLDAEAYLEDVFRVASGEPIENRLVMPGTDMYEMMMEDINREYQFRKENPDFGRNLEKH